MAALALLVSSSPLLTASTVVGPYLGSVSTSEAHLLYRHAETEQEIKLTAIGPDGKVTTSYTAKTFAKNDYVAKFHLVGLKPDTKYSYKIELLDGEENKLITKDVEGLHFKTYSPKRTGEIVNAAFISCVKDNSDGIWAQMLEDDLDLLCLSGDTPYIDTEDLKKIRSKHRHLLQRKDLAKLGKNTSVLGTWDDHDFGRNNGNGVTVKGKPNTLKGFVEYRAHDQFGSGKEGVYHKSDLGSLEVFLTDPRWYSMTEPSPVDPTQATCFGKDQWAWLLKSLKESKAPFKVLLMGQIWQDKKGGETDDMHTYWAERDALFDFIKKEKITGVVLVGGDIHVSRYLMHPQRLGYDLHDYVVSPGHTGVIKSLNVYHPSLDWSRAKANQYLLMKADTTKDVPELTVTYSDINGATNFQTVITLDQLSPRETTDITKDLRVYYPLDQDLKNHAILGSRNDATAQNNAKLTKNGALGGAVKFHATKQQYLAEPRSFLDDNASAYTYSVWVKPDSLPENGSKDRSFILESSINNHCDLPKPSKTGYALSAGFRAASGANKINLQLYAETINPEKFGTRKSPGVASQGGFDCFLDRNIFDQWTHVTVTFDSKSLKLYINGKLTKTHKLPIPAPIAETGGLVIGGHRAGTGRNYDGLIDEVAIWNRTLSDAEVSKLYNNGTPVPLITK